MVIVTDLNTVTKSGVVWKRVPVEQIYSHNSYRVCLGIQGRLPSIIFQIFPSAAWSRFVFPLPSDVILFWSSRC